MMKKGDKNMSKFEFNKEAKSYLAKLLATENLTVEHRKVKTAYFDLEKRLLVVPIWKEMNVDILDLLLAHEIGHALYTPQDEWKEAIDKKIPHSFLNVVEDARIEKLIKRKYPGLSQSFIKGYRDLIANDFFKTADKDVNEMLLIDRLNMHFKSSHVESTIEFNDDVELEFVDRMANVETFAEVEVLAKDLAEYCKGESELKSLDDHDFESIFGDDGEDNTEGDADDGDNNGNGDADKNDGDGEESDENSNSGSSKDGEEGDEEGKNDEFTDSSGDQFDTSNDGVAPGDWYPSSETDDAWENRKSDLIDEKSKDNVYFHVHEFKNLNEYVFDYKRVLQDFRDNKNDRDNRHSYYKEAWVELVADYKKFQKKQSKAVNYMVKEFELKKAATAHSRSMQANSGVVDPLKLHSYKFNDDIFKRLTVTPDGKNHGLMMFIDWSGSMHDKLEATIHQLMNLTMFCRKVSIPFEVYAFSNNSSYNRVWVEGKDEKERIYPNVDYQNGDITVDRQLTLLNLISSKMSAKEYEEGMINLYFVSIKYGYDPYSYRRRNYNYEAAKAEQWKGDLMNIPLGYNLASTPLNDSIMAAMKMVPAFKRKYNIDKMNTVFLTDGCSDGGEKIVVTDSKEIEDGAVESSGSGWWGRRSGQEGLHFKDFNSWQVNKLMTDRLTKKTFKVGDNRDGLTDALLKILKLRTGSKVLGFYVAEKTTIDAGTLNRYFPENNYYAEPGVKLYDRKKVKAEFRKNKCLVVTEKTGYDELYLLAGGNMKVLDGEMATPSENAKKGEIKRLFAGSLKANKSSRVVLNKFISKIA